ncbi:MAG: ABC transporter substrate-binding protein, partial [Proteobacteria bacterium]|nr:ABC transporter substrate-binding protein [Pseudomonadota bacterium]
MTTFFRCDQLTYFHLMMTLCGSLLGLSLAHNQALSQQKSPNRIVSLSLASDETLYELLKKKGELPRLIAVSTTSADPKYSYLSHIFHNKTKLKQVPAAIEDVLRLAPDFVVAAKFNNPKLLRAIKNHKINHLILDKFSSINDLINNTHILAKAVNAEEQGQELVQLIRDELKQKSHLSQHSPKKTMLSFSSSLHIMGQNTLFSDLLHSAGFQNALALPGWPKLTLEFLLKIEPDYIVAPCAPKNQNKVFDYLQTTRGWREKKSVQTKKIICIEYRALYSTSFHIVQALRQLKAGYKNV